MAAVMSPSFPTVPTAPPRNPPWQAWGPWGAWLAVAAAGLALAGPLGAFRTLVLGPWVEEVLFRLGLQRTLAARLPGRASVALTAAAFAAFHLAVVAALPGPLDPVLGWLALATAAPAYWIGRLFQRTGRLGPCVAAHALANLIWLGVAQPAHAADLARGQGLYDQYCLACHGPAEAPVNATSLNARNLGPVLREGIANARSGMLFLGDVLSASDIDDIAAFLGNTPLALAFPAQALDEAGAVLSVQVRAGRENVGRLAVTVEGEYTRVGGTCTTGLAANTACSVDIAFRPRGLGARPGAVLIAHDGIATPARLPLSGVGAPASRGVLASDLSSLAFGAGPVGGPEALQRLEVQNLGSASLTLAPIRLTGAAAADFRVAGGTCSVGAVLVPAGRCTLEVAFRATATGPRAATLELSAADGSSALSLVLQGVGQSRPAPLLVLDTQRLDFGVQVAGQVSLAREVVARNQGSAPLNWISRIAPPAFTIQGDCIGTLAPGAACRLEIRFLPAAIGPTEGRLVLLTDSEGGPQELSLVGEGVRAAPQLAWLPERASLDVGTSPVGRAGRSDALLLVNPGPDPVTLLAFSIAGSQAAEFAVAASTTCRIGQVLAAGERCSVAIEFLPRAAGPREASLSLSASGEAPRVLRLSGTGQNAAATNLGGGGCTLGGGHPAFDPIWPLLVLAALGVLALRRWQERTAARRAGTVDTAGAPRPSTAAGADASRPKVDS